jgi:hypothetical protein
LSAAAYSIYSQLTFTSERASFEKYLSFYILLGRRRMGIPNKSLTVVVYGPVMAHTSFNHPENPLSSQCTHLSTLLITFHFFSPGSKEECLLLGCDTMWL